MSEQVRTAFVTGATGIAHGSVVAMAAAGLRLVLAGRDRQGLEALAGTLPPAPERLIVPMDVTSEASVAGAVARGADFADGTLDILLNGHGMQGPHTLTTWALPTADFDRTMAVNLRGVFLTMRAVLPLMIPRRSGRVVTIGGTYGFRYHLYYPSRRQHTPACALLLEAIRYRGWGTRRGAAARASVVRRDRAPRVRPPSARPRARPAPH